MRDAAVMAVMRMRRCPSDRRGWADRENFGPLSVDNAIVDGAAAASANVSVR